MTDGTPEEMNGFVDWCYGKETDATYGTVAKFIQNNVKRRPAVGSHSRWPDFDAIKTFLHYNPGPTAEELDAAIAAFRAG